MSRKSPIKATNTFTFDIDCNVLNLKPFDFVYNHNIRYSHVKGTYWNAIRLQWIRY